MTSLQNKNLWPDLDRQGALTRLHESSTTTTEASDQPWRDWEAKVLAQEARAKSQFRWKIVGILLLLTAAVFWLVWRV
jgi:hypothetical protein